MKVSPLIRPHLARRGLAGLAAGAMFVSSLVTVGLVTASPANAVVAGSEVVINEVESNGDPDGDWVELYNVSTHSVSLSGYTLSDNDDSHRIELSGTIPAGGYVSYVTDGAFGLGGIDAVRLFGPGSVVGGTPVDEYWWVNHAAITYGRYPDGTGAFVSTTTSTFNAPNVYTGSGNPDPDTLFGVYINEVESNGDAARGDWIELRNTTSSAKDLGGAVLSDNNNSHVYTIPAGTTIAAGGYKAFVVQDAAGVGAFGLGNVDEVRLFERGTTDLMTADSIDSVSWTTHSPTTYGRDGSRDWAITSAGTYAAANTFGGFPSGLAGKVVINEIESNLDSRGDWVEIYNKSNVTQSVASALISDNDNTHVFRIPATTPGLAPGGYAAFRVNDPAVDGPFGLGNVDSARLFDAGTMDVSQTTPIDSYSWTAHATTTLGRLPNGTGAFSVTERGTPGRPNGSAPTAPSIAHSVVINEIESDGDSIQGDWVELYNKSGFPQTIAGAAISDNNDTHAFKIPAATPALAPGAYAAFRVNNPTFGGSFDLGDVDSVRLFDADSSDIIAWAPPADSFSWTAHAPTTYGRLPNGGGLFRMTSPGTFGIANPKSTQTSGVSTTQTADTAMSVQFPDGFTEALLVPADSDELVAEASAYAAASGIPVLAYPTTTASQILSRLAALGATSLSLYGPASAFSSGFRSELSGGGVSMSSEILGDTSSARTLSAATLLDKHSELVVVDARSSSHVRALAASVAARLASPILALPAGAADPATTAHFADQAYTNIIQVGSLNGVDTSALTGTEASPTTVTPFDDTDASVNEHEIATLQSGNGNSVRTVFTAPADQPASLVLAAWQSSESGVFLTGPQLSGGPAASATPAGKWTSQLGEEVANVHAVGNSLPANYALELVDLGVPRLNPPAFRIESVTHTVGTVTAKFTAIGGASLYKAFDVEGTLVGTAPTPTFVLPEGTGALQVVALNGTTELQRIEFRTNDALAATGTSGAALTSSGDIHVLKWFDDTSTPRLITRQPLDPENMEATDLTEAVPVGITCESSFVDVTSDRTRQWRYVALTLAGPDGGGCGEVGSSQPSSPQLSESTINVPPFEYPQSPTARMMSAVYNSSASRSARPTYVDALLSSEERGKSKATNGMARAPGDDWLPFKLRYQGYIAKDKVFVPFPTLSLFRPVMMLGGDGDDRKPNPVSDAYRFRVDTTFYFGSSHHIGFSRDIGESHRYNCVLLHTGCSNSGTATASTSGLQLRDSFSANTRGSAEIEVDTGVPVLAGWMAPNINAHLLYSVRAGGSAITGYHDKMPWHEIWGGPVPGEYFPLHATNGSVPCLFGGLPKCTVNVSVSF